MEFTGKDAKGNGTFLGRTLNSWIKILLFYVVYYSFLACLIYYAVTLRASNLTNQPGDNVPPMIRTRTDSPGAAVYPFHSIESSIDGDGVLDLTNDKHSKAYVKAMNTFTEFMSNKDDTDKEVERNVGDCSNPAVKPEDFTCKVPNVGELEKIDFQKSIDEKAPVFVVNLNKIYNWKPINYGKSYDRSSTTSAATGLSFKKNSVELNCYQFKPKEGIVKDSEFEISLIGESSLQSHYFPYIGQDIKGGQKVQVAYNKPFFIGKITPKNGAESWKLVENEKGSGMEKHKTFRCELLADNIERPAIGDDFWNNPEKQGWSNDLAKTLNLGYVEFGFAL